MDYMLRCMLKLFKSSFPDTNVDISIKEESVGFIGYLLLVLLAILLTWIFKKYFRK